MELMDQYGPVDMLWFDHTFGKWDLYTIPRLFEKMYAKNPSLLVNDRAAKALPDIPEKYEVLNKADFDTPENRMGAFQYGRAWESCMILSPHARTDPMASHARSRKRCVFCLLLSPVMATCS